MNIMAIRNRENLRSRLFERVASILLRSIIKGEYPVGVRLPTERSLAQSFGVNRSTIREALKRLESLDVIEIRHGDGVYVKDYLESPSLELIRAMFYLDGELDTDLLMTLLEIRQILVPEMAALAALRRRENHVRDLMRLAYEDTGLSVLERDIQVHRTIAQASGNMLYLVLLNFFNRFFREYGHLYFDIEENARRSEQFHTDIAHSVAEGDADRARQVMRDVLEYARKAVMKVIEDNGLVKNKERK